MFSDFKLAVLFLLCITVAYANHIYKNRPEVVTQLKQGKIAALWQTPPEEQKAGDPLRRPVEDYAAEVHRYFEQENFGVLEKLVATLRANGQRLPGGEWKLTAFYRGLRPNYAEQQTPVRWQSNLSKLDKWAKQFPASATPLIAMVDNFAQFAEPLQTKAELDKLPPNRRQQINEGIVLGEQALKAAEATEAKDPHLYAAMLELGRVAGWNKTKFDELYHEGARLEPAYQHLHEAKAAYLLPTWYGEAGESEEFTQSVAEEVGGAAGQQLYFLVTTNALSRTPKESFAATRFSLGNAKDGFQSLEKSYGIDTRTLNEHAKLLVRNGDLAGAETMFKRIGGNFDAAAWQGKTEFENARANAAQASGGDAGVLGNYKTALLGVYGVGMILARNFLGAAAGPVTNLMTLGVLTGVSAEFNQQEKFTELMNWTRDTIDALSAIIARSVR
ncbi:MAG: hypothetical protein HY011_14855 [Acidobacteria bacterium]|nr:hypothetical protein [Acidobacteriota bacterium]